MNIRYTTLTAHVEAMLDLMYVLQVPEHAEQKSCRMLIPLCADPGIFLLVRGRGPVSVAV